MRSDQPFDRNFWLNVADGAFVSGGIAMFSVQVILPAWLTQLGAGPLVIGLLSMVWFTGYAMPQIFFAEYVKPFPFRKPTLVRWGALMRIPWILLAAAIWALAAHPRLLIVATFIAIIMFVGGVGAVNPVWVQLMGKLTPSSQRGRLQGFRMLFGGGVGLGSAWIIRVVLARWSFPYNYALLFGLGSLLLAASWACFAGLTEHQPSDTLPRRGPWAVVKDAVVTVREDRRLRQFSFSAFFAQLAVWMPAAFLVSFGLARKLIRPEHVGEVAVILALTSMGWSALFGWLGDRYGNRRLLVFACGCAMAASASALLAPWHPGWLYAAVAWSGGGLIACGVALPNVTLEISPQGAEAKYAAISSLIFSLAGAMGPFLAGIIVERGGYPTMFWCAVALGLGGWWFVSGLKGGENPPLGRGKS